MNVMAIHLRCGSKFSLKSIQYIGTMNPIELTAEYVIKSHYSQSAGIAHRIVVIKKGENE